MSTKKLIYNNVILPELPEDAYTYKVMKKDTTAGFYYLYCCETDFVVNTDLMKSTYYNSAEEMNKQDMQQYSIAISDAENNDAVWTFNTMMKATVKNDNVIWTSHTIEKNDKTIIYYLASPALNIDTKFKEISTVEAEDGEFVGNVKTAVRAAGCTVVTDIVGYNNNGVKINVTAPKEDKFLVRCFYCNSGTRHFQVVVNESAEPIQISNIVCSGENTIDYLDLWIDLNKGENTLLFKTWYINKAPDFDKFEISNIMQAPVNKVIYDGNVLIDLTEDTVTPDTLAEGATAHNAAGVVIVGTMAAGGGGDSDELLKKIIERSQADIVIPEGIKTIGIAVFSYYYRLQSVEMPDTVVSIADQAFNYCTNLLSIKLSNKLTSIGSSGFSNSSMLQSIEIPDTVKKIGQYAFSNCVSLASVKLPNSITQIQNYCFSSCSALTEITIPEKVTTIGARAFDNCNKLTKVEFPDVLQTIGQYAFRYCSMLPSIALPASMKSIDTTAFSGCSALTKIYCKFSEGAVAGAPWGATNAEIIYDWDGVTE